MLNEGGGCLCNGVVFVHLGVCLRYWQPNNMSSLMRITVYECAHQARALLPEMCNGPYFFPFVL